MGQRFPRSISAWSALIGQTLVAAPVLADAQPGFALMPLIAHHESGKIIVSQTHRSMATGAKTHGPKTKESKITAFSITGPNIMRPKILGSGDVGTMPEVSPTMVFRIPQPAPTSILDGPPRAAISPPPARVVQQAELPALIATAEPVSRDQTVVAATYGPPADLADSPYAVAAGQNSVLPDEAMSFEQEANSAPDEPQEPSTPPGDTESLTSAIIAALKANPEIQIALAIQDDSRYAVHEAWAGYMPHLDLTLGYGREFVKQAGRAGTYRMRTEGSITLNQNLWDFGVTLNDIRRARATFRSAQWATRERIEAIAYDISSAYLVILQQQKLYELTTAEMDATRKILKVVTIQKELGLTTSADVGRVQARLESLQSVLLDRRDRRAHV